MPFFILASRAARSSVDIAATFFGSSVAPTQSSMSWPLKRALKPLGGLLSSCARAEVCVERDLEEGEERKEAKPQAGGERGHVLHLEGVVSTDGSVGRESFDFSCAKRGREAVGWLQKRDSCD